MVITNSAFRLNAQGSSTVLTVSAVILAWRLVLGGPVRATAASQPASAAVTEAPAAGPCVTDVTLPPEFVPPALLANRPATQTSSSPLLALPEMVPFPSAAEARSEMVRPIDSSQPPTEPVIVTDQPVRPGSETLGQVLVTADLDAKRDQIAPSLGAVSYTIGPNQIQTTGQGANAPLQQVLLHAPGVVQDEFGEVHVRGDHGDLQYRINGVLLPEQLNGFGQEVDTRMINSVTLVDGTLPAQFGDRTAGIIDVTTKTGTELNGGELSLYGGAYNTYQPSLSLGGVAGKLEYFATTSYKQNNLGIDNTTVSRTPIHDQTEQDRFFGYFSYRLDTTSRLTLLVNAAYADFEIPATPGLLANYKLIGSPRADSAAVDDTQNEQNYYTVISYQTFVDRLSLQLSAFTRYNDIQFNPDPVQDLLFDGVAGKVINNDLANGVQLDASYVVDAHHTVRGGLLVTYDIEQLNTNTNVFPASGQFLPDVPPAMQTSDVPRAVNTEGRNTGITAGFYIQDEWRLTDALTVNFGVRADLFDTNFDTEDQLSPRVNLVYKFDKGATTAHAGYARYFMPPTLQYISPATVRQFEYTSNAPFNEQDDPQKAERDNYFDVGISRQINPAWQVNLDSFCKLAKNLLDDGQFGSAVILNNFNYRTGTIYGAEFSTTCKQGPFSAYGNFSYVQTRAKDVNSAQYEFPSDELSYIQTHSIQLDHQQLYTASVGVSYAINKYTRVYGDFLYGNGLRAGFANLEKLPAYYPLNVGIEHVFRIDSRNSVKLRFDCLNVFDEVYELRNGTGLGIAAPAYGPRRSFFAGLSYEF